jgi:capsular polysaccharide export protein
VIRITGSLQGQNILLLQGPNGTFFRRLDNFFRRNNANTYRICFNAGDRFFANKDNRIDFKAPADQWKSYIRQVMIDLQIDKIFLFGDCRFYHRIAIKAAKALNIDCFVFEEGYIRPDFVTLEKSGVNAYSSLPREKRFYETQDLETLTEMPILPAKNSAAKMYWQTSIYYFLNNLLRLQYPHYYHHRRSCCLREAFCGVRSGVRKLRFRVTEPKYNEKLKNQWAGRYYFVPLQTYNDFQLRVHSPFERMEDFIEKVLASFARYAPVPSKLVFKHHPVDRGVKEYSHFICKKANALNVADRVYSLHDIHLPTCLKNARGTVTINSTVGLSSLFHKTPTITLGDAAYDIDGLTCKGMSLDAFWTNLHKPDPILYKKYRRYLIQNTQLNGSFYGIFPAETSTTDKTVEHLVPVSSINAFFSKSNASTI